MKIFWFASIFHADDPSFHQVFSKIHEVIRFSKLITTLTGTWAESPTGKNKLDSAIVRLDRLCSEGGGDDGLWDEMSASSPGEATRAEDLNRPQSRKRIRDLRGCYVIKTGLNALANEYQENGLSTEENPVRSPRPSSSGTKGE